METRSIALLAAAVALAAGAGATADLPSSRSIPDAARPLAASEVVARMVDAHGGMDAWRAAPAIHFTHVLYMGFLPDGADRWWVGEQAVETTDPRRSYQSYPLEGARMAYDGERTWSTGWSIPNPPEFMVYFDLYYIFLPWMTQSRGVVLGEPGTDRLPGDARDYTTVEMRFAAGHVPVGKGERDFFRLFIDPRTDRLAAIEYVATYPRFLEVAGRPADGQFGPLYHVYDEWRTVDGLVVPVRYHTLEPGGELAGDHVVLDVSFARPFDEARLAMPEGAEIAEPAS